MLVRRPLWPAPSPAATGMCLRDEPRSELRRMMCQPLFRRARLRNGNGTGLAGLFTSTTVTRCTVRPQILYRRVDDRCLLSAHLPRAHGAREKCSVLHKRRGSHSGRLPSLPAVSARVLTGYARVAWYAQHGVASPATD